MPEQLRPESKDLGEAATTTLNPEPKTLNNKFIIIINTIHNEYYINTHPFISFIKTMIDTNSYRLLILCLSLVKIVLSNAKSASE